MNDRSIAARAANLAAILGSTIAGLSATNAEAQLRVATWNVTNYSSGRVSDFTTSFFGTFEGRSFDPDCIVGQEFLSQTGVNNFLAILNNGGSGTWAAAPFVNGPDTDNAFFYRTDKLDFLGHTVVATGGFSPNHPRNIDRYDVRVKGYSSEGATISLYSSHMKAGSGSNDQSRRLLEAQRIRGDAELLPSARSFILGGDFNIQSSSQAAYQEMVGNQINNDGRFFDPINRAGSWNNNSTFRTIHTQDPSGAGGMDDRHDQILLSQHLVDGTGMDYIGDPLIPYSLSTWNDPNHSYRSWGNDGTSYNTSLTTTGNTMVGASIATALRNTQAGGGHLPVFLDMTVPPAIESDLVLDFGTVELGAPAELTLSISNDGDVALWTEQGVAPLEYTLAAPAGFTAPAGMFIDNAGGSGFMHTITMDTSSEGTLGGFLTIASNAPDEPTRFVTLTGEVVSPACPGDINTTGTTNGIPDGITNLSDLQFFLTAYQNDLGMSPGSPADVNTTGTTNGVPDGTVNLADLQYFLTQWQTGLGECS